MKDLIKRDSDITGFVDNEGGINEIEFIKGKMVVPYTSVRVGPSPGVINEFPAFIYENRAQYTFSLLYPKEGPLPLYFSRDQLSGRNGYGHYGKNLIHRPGLPLSYFNSKVEMADFLFRYPQITFPDNLPLPIFDVNPAITVDHF